MKQAHIYAKVLKNGEVIGRFRPETWSSSVRAEVSTFQIGRALGCGALFQPAMAMELHGQGLRSFRRQLESAKFPPPKDAERDALLGAIVEEPDLLRGVYKPMVPKEATKYLAAERTREAPNGGLETGDVIARYLRHDSPQPGREMITVAGSQTSAESMARQLSNIMLVDALAGQWDRFSGNNLHLLRTVNGPQLMAIDNGGADPVQDQGYLEKFTRWVTRFDPVTVEHLAALEAFLHGRGPFRGFTSEPALQEALGFDDPKEWRAFKERVHGVSMHVNSARSSGFFNR